MNRSSRAGQVVLALLGLLSIVIALSVYGAPDPFESDAQALIASFGAGFGVMVVMLAVAGLNAGQTWAWLVLWILPVFFISHVVLVGTLLPDGAFAVVSVLSLVATRPSTRVYTSRPSPVRTSSSPSTSLTTE